MPELSREQGSVLVTVLGLSIAMSLAAGSILLVAGNAQNDEDQEFLRQRCFNDAESGLMIGAAWMKYRANARTFITTNQGWTGNATTLFADSLYENGSRVTVTLSDNTQNGQPTKTVSSRAVLGTLSLQFSWDIGASTDNDPSDGSPILSMANWRAP